MHSGRAKENAHECSCLFSFLSSARFYLQSNWILTAGISLSLRRARLTVLRRGLAEYLYICHHQSPENNEQCVPSCFISHQRRARCTKKHNIYGLHAEWCGFQKISQFVPRALLYQKERCALMAVFISKRSLLGMSKRSSAIYREGKEGNWTWQKKLAGVKKGNFADPKFRHSVIMQTPKKLMQSLQFLVKCVLSSFCVSNYVQSPENYLMDWYWSYIFFSSSSLLLLANDAFNFINLYNFVN